MWYEGKGTRHGIRREGTTCVHRASLSGWRTEVDYKHITSQFVPGFFFFF